VLYFQAYAFVDYAQDHAELGAALNGFSLNENGQLSTAIEKTGQAVDATYMSTTWLVRLVTLMQVRTTYTLLYVASRT
jgi:hypothetical protein